ncbi:proline-rich protein 36-like [Spodoptera litura]|uniref:Proline-rich protein 36-like n=1 Tax=Spodoptera litura TaxID=69820 RepID=A0A9J7DVB0_SPOLT|nr:proline-rich protein 36-like [Spodoptera litura]
MARVFICFLLIQCFVLKVLSSYPQPTVQQYLQLMGLPQPHTIAVPAPQPAPSNQPCPPSQPRPPPSPQTLAALALPNLVSRLQQSLPPTSNQPRPVSTPPSLSAIGLPNLVAPKSEIKAEKPSSVDAKLLNNLAVALQLLIVSNILNSPPPKESLLAKSASENSPYAPPCSAPSLPNSNFIGGSNYPEQGLSKSYKPTRNGLALMSPYEALAPVKSYSDSYSFGSLNPRQDFQSPYAVFADQDLFSMNDLF